MFWLNVGFVGLGVGDLCMYLLLWVFDVILGYFKLIGTYYLDGFD